LQRGIVDFHLGAFHFSQPVLSKYEDVVGEPASAWGVLLQNLVLAPAGMCVSDQSPEFSPFVKNF